MAEESRQKTNLFHKNSYIKVHPIALFHPERYSMKITILLILIQ